MRDKDSSRNEDGIFSDFTGNDSIHALNPSDGKGSDVPGPLFPPVRVSLQRGERADYLSEFSRVVGGDVKLDRNRHTADVQLFAGAKALRTQASKALLDTGSPASFIQEKVWKRMLACSAASEDGLSSTGQKRWGGFHGVPLVTSHHVCPFKHTL